MQIMEGDLARTIEATSAASRHIQLADNPGRHEPGTGEINYPFLYEHIDRIGYSGWVGANTSRAADRPMVSAGPSALPASGHSSPRCRTMRDDTP